MHICHKSAVYSYTECVQSSYTTYRQYTVLPRVCKLYNRLYPSCRLLESPEKDCHKTAQQVVDTVDSKQAGHLSSEHKGTLKHSVYTTLSDTSPSTPPAGKPSLSSPPPDTPCESSAAGSVSSDKPNHDDVSGASAEASHEALSHNGPSNSTLQAQHSHNTAGQLHANARAFVPNINAAAFVPSSAPKISIMASHTTNGHEHTGFANGFSPSAESGSSPYAAWEDTAFTEASSYQNGWAGGYDGYGGYADPYAGYGYGGMTPDGLFIPQQVCSNSCMTPLLQSCVSSRLATSLSCVCLLCLL